ncbi:MAG: ribonuclease III [Atopobiaceae bacterium]|nr:ribonuclease III [Atopobiaceae bacterium]
MKLRARIKAIQQIVGHEFEDQDLVVSAITHPSAAEGKSVSASYERLEFLGDSVLGTLVALHVYRRFPGMNEGELSNIRTTLISGEMLSRVAEDLGVGQYLLLGHSERGTQARGMHKALEDVYEALVAALYLDGGMEVASAFVNRTLLCYVTPDLAKRPLSPKSRLQEVTQRDFHCGPTYKLVGEEGPAHTPTFTTVVFVESRRVGRGKGSTKKESESAAALDALRRMGYAKEASMGMGGVSMLPREDGDVS